MDTDYWHSMDRQFAKNTGLSTDYISVSTHPFKEQLDELKAKIFSGTKNVELSFIATGSGSRSQGQSVPEHYGKEEREELRQLAKINDIDLSVHNPANAPPLSGFSQRGFSPEVKQDSLKELKRTIEFAADVARGGSITVHTQEFQRPIFEGDKESKKLRGYEKEEERSALYFVDKRTGQVQGFGRNQEIPFPKTENGTVLRNQDGSIKEWENKRIYDLEQEAIKKGQEPVKYIYQRIKEKEFEFEKGQAKESLTKAKKLEEDYNYLKKVTTDVETAFKENKNRANYQAIKLVEDLEKSLRERVTPREGTVEYNDFLEKPIDYLKKIRDRIGNESASLYEIADSRQRSIEQLGKEVDNIEPIEKYALKETADTVAKAAIYAYEKEKTMKLEKPLVISPENVFAQTYGSHPAELKKIIEESRNAMVEQLVKGKFVKDETEAKKIAEERIKATFDIGHVNTWRQYFSEKDPTGEKFNKYILGEIGELSKRGLIGHVHINDNFGYEDIHITPGQGNAPIKEFVDKITGEGFKGKMVIEAGNQKGGEGWQVLPGALKVLDSPIYRVDSLYSTWTDIQGSYFGKTGSPNYIVGDLAPSKDWTLWSESQLE